MRCPTCGKDCYKIWGNGSGIVCNECGIGEIGTKITPNWLRKSREKLGDKYEIIPPTDDGKVGGVFERK